MSAVYCAYMKAVIVKPIPDCETTLMQFIAGEFNFGIGSERKRRRKVEQQVSLFDLSSGNTAYSVEANDKPVFGGVNIIT
ncbi:MAG: hypothetical protein PHU23_06315 [Dehalococcoidales bacterium]|nr:hypothetical protein [Dehalococcoidales bacterium]